MQIILLGFVVVTQFNFFLSEIYPFYAEVFFLGCFHMCARFSLVYLPKTRISRRSSVKLNITHFICVVALAYKHTQESAHSAFTKYDKKFVHKDRTLLLLVPPEFTALFRTAIWTGKFDYPTNRPSTQFIFYLTS